MKKYLFIIASLILIGTSVFSQSCPLSCLPEDAVYELSPLYYPSGQAKFTTITSQIPQIAKTGIKTIYLMPVFKESGVGLSASDTIRFSNAYNVQDYYKVDTYYGTDTDLQKMIDTAHTYGLRVLFDLVLNHTYYPSVFMDSAWDYRVDSVKLADSAAARGYPVKYDTISGQVFPYVNKQYIAGDSTYSFRGWKDSKGVIHVMHYPTWRWWFGLDYTNPGLIRYVANLSRYFIKHFNFDGWRLDAPSDNVNPWLFSGSHPMTTLLQTVKDSMVAIKPSCVMISECPHSGRADTSTNDFDKMVEASYDANYTLNTLATSGAMVDSSYLVHNLLSQITKEKILYGRYRLRFSENHDSKRINALSPKLNFPLLVFNTTIYPGIPMIQGGQETGATTLLYSIPTAAYDTAQKRIWDFYRKVLHVRNLFTPLKYGYLTNVQSSTTGDSSKVYSYTRDTATSHILVMVNFDSVAVTNTVTLPYTTGTVLYDSLSTDTFTVTTPSAFHISVPAYSARILIPKNFVLDVNNIEQSPILNSYAYPNPFASSTTIYAEKALNDARIEIYNVCGQRILTLDHVNGNKLVLNRGGLSAGVYFFRILEQETILSVGKLVIMEN